MSATLILPGTRLILPSRGLVLEHREIVRVPAWGGLDVPSLRELREIWRKFKDGMLDDWRKDGWIPIAVMSAPPRAFRAGMPARPGGLSGLVGMDRMPAGGATIPTGDLVIDTFYITGTGLTHNIDEQTRIVEIVGTGAGGTGGRGGGHGAGAGGGACTRKRPFYTAPAAGRTLAIDVGARGALVAGGPGVDGGTTNISGSILTTPLQATGGIKGTGTAAGGLGGTASGGDDNYAGGQGGPGTGGGGGGAGGTTGAGGNAGQVATGSAGSNGTGNGGGGGATHNSGPGGGGGGPGKPGGFHWQNSAVLFNGGQAGSDGGLLPKSQQGADIDFNAAGGNPQGGGLGGGGEAGSSGGVQNSVGGGSGSVVIREVK